MRVVSGIQPSGNLHLGNYFGAVKQLVDFQERAEETLLFIADLHALTSVQEGERLRSLSFGLALDLMSLGVDPARTMLFRQSEVPEVTQLAWLLASATPLGLLERGHAYKDKVARGLPASAALFTYPLLMAADVLLYAADLVPVGADQRQHVEITRDVAAKLNRRLGSELLKLPEAFVLDATAVVPGLDGEKMSKSYSNTLDLFADEAELRRRIMGIQTDSTPVAAPKPLPSPLLSLLRLLCDPKEAAAHQESWVAGGVGYGAYKARLLERLLERFAPARARRRELAAAPESVERVLADGAARARAIARPLWHHLARAAGISAAA